jgi:ATP-binding cassette subfamily B multidrug efflux pump
MISLFKYFTRNQWWCIAVSMVCIVFQVWLDLKLPDYMSSITTLVQTEGSKMADILTQGGYMMLCAFGSLAFSIIAGHFAAKVAAGLAKTLRGNVYGKVMGSPWKRSTGSPPPA